MVHEVVPVTRLTRFDREVVALWAEVGEIPDGHTERQTALNIMVKALHDLDEMHQIVQDFKALS
jgi:hypothetical protein